MIHAQQSKGAALLCSCALAILLSTITPKSFAADETKTAIFAGGCFWCVESDFDNVPGVISTVSGYIGGNTDSPTYKNHSAGKHREAVEIVFDPAKVSFAELVEVLWRSVNPTDAGGQFCDRGHSYTTAIYTLDETQADVAEASRSGLQESGVLSKPIATSIEPATTFWPAEDYHQDYYLKNPIRYKFYRTSCGRDKQVRIVWGEQAHAGISKH
ncbi:peptide-methionine (S)-S-oxide reductase [Chromatiales bacterium (ex Bugula neritina AB1)]|nr:peptide-methionine (S)-S-oxide reductase [Chromatiales bacterium (ex Bugula neritina AB1)]